MTNTMKRAALEAEGYTFETRITILGRRQIVVRLNGVVVCDKNWPSREHVTKYVRHVFEHRPHHDSNGNDLRKLHAEYL